MAARLDKATAEKEQLELHAMKNFNEILEMRKEAQAIEEEILRLETPNIVENLYWQKRITSHSDLQSCFKNIKCKKKNDF